MRVIFIVLCIFLSIKFIANTQCAPNLNLAGHCGCCPLIGGNCIHFITIDGVAASWHTCVPDHLKDNFTLENCRNNITFDKNMTRLCHTKNGTFRFFPQCITKDLCYISLRRPTCIEIFHI